MCFFVVVDFINGGNGASGENLIIHKSKMNVIWSSYVEHTWPCTSIKLLKL
jgi:hypothetical protein